MRYITILFFFIPLILNAQLVEDFSDGDFTSNPVWSGDDTQFEVSNSTSIPANMRPALRLQSTGTDMSYLSTAFSPNFADSLEWNFWIKFSFNPSANNWARFYLVSDQADLEGNLNGYFVGIGEDSDKITFCRQDGATITTLISSNIIELSNSTNIARIRVERKTNGEWLLACDTLGGANFYYISTVVDQTYSSSSFCGLYCKYTTSNATKIFFDELYAGQAVVDTIKPALNNIAVTSASELDVWFTEAVDGTSSVITSNYIVDNGIGNPIAVIQDAIDPSLVHLSFASNFPLNVQLSLFVDQVEDLNGNVMDQDTLSFAIYDFQPFDIVINEIMADPEPTINLPPYEYLELRNVTSLPANIKDWTMTIGSNELTFTDVTIPANGYLIVCKDDYVADFQQYGEVVGLFSSASQLTNGGQTLILKNPDAEIIHAVQYLDDWYQDPLKSDGGWSLEQIDPLNPCGGMSNWKASTSSLGGTPGAINAVDGSNPDAVGPGLLRVSINKFSPDELMVFFDENLDSTSIVDPLFFTIDNGVGNPVSVTSVDVNFKEFRLQFAAPFQIQTIYELTVNDSIRDCVGNIIASEKTARFAIPGTPSAGDIVINEVLSNPKDDGVDYVELYNQSDKIIDLRDLVIASYDTIGMVLETPKEIAANGYLLFSGEYVVLTEDMQVVMDQYQTPGAKVFCQVVDLPSYSNNDGIVALSDLGGNLIDMMTYDENMHFAMLETTDGVSLERIDPERPSDDRTNWHSASENSGFGTPGYENSQYFEGAITESPIFVEPELFSPDNDGHNDVLNISYEFDTPGYVANLTIYDAKGRQIRYLVKNELLGTSGTWSWDGLTDERQKAGVGIYIIFFEVFDLDGNVKSYKEVCVLGTRF